MFSNKSRSLVLLEKKKNLIFNIPNFIVINIFDWKKKKEDILKKIRKKFKNNFLIIRSSASDEDNKFNTNAGKYKSIENIKTSDKSKLEKSINEVAQSIKKKRKLNKSDEVIVQKMIKNVSLSGVVFTKLIENGSNYYSINYDDISGKTNLVTSGNSENSNKMLYVRKGYVYCLRSKRFLILIKAVKNLEKNLSSDELDIEFGVDKNLKPYLFQVRKLVFGKKNKKKLRKKVNVELNKVSNKIEKELKRKNSVYGKRGIFGNMPDWNPAEIIGEHPSDLSKSLFSTLITNNVWAKARQEIGYNCLKKTKLIHFFAGQPFVDVRLSFNSFLLKNIPSSVKEKLVNHWLNILKLHPEYHDKVEFLISINCFTFDDKKSIQYKLPKNISLIEKKAFLSSLKKITLSFIKEKKIINKQIKKINQLNEVKFEDFKGKNIINTIKVKIKECKDLGTLPFSILARFAFISTSILESLVKEKIITYKEKDNFLRSIKNVTTIFLEDVANYKLGKIKKNLFYKKYGHLRPGTYDILSKNYKDSKILLKIDSKKNLITQNKKFNLSKKSKIKFKKVLYKHNIHNLKLNDFFDFFYKSIKYREQAKFIYSKSINQILILLAEYGKYYKLDKKQVSFLDLSNIFLIEKNFSGYKKKKIKLEELIKKNINYDKVNKRIKLPQLIFDKEAAYIVPHITSTPNFITTKKVISKFKEINSRNLNVKISKKIVLIENADPGFDWIFDKGINGLITKHGGANSHMAIRCSELNLPAAIGIGEKKYMEIVSTKNKYVELNCLLKKMDNIKW